MAGGDTVSFENRYHCRDGSFRWLSWSATPLPDQKRIYAAARDVTDRRLTEERLARERNLLRTLMDNLPDHIFVKDLQSRFITANTSTLRSLGAFALREVVGKTDFDFLPPERAEQYRADEREVARTGEPLTNREELLIDAAGRVALAADHQGAVVGGRRDRRVGGHQPRHHQRKQAEEALAERTRLAALGAEVGAALTRAGDPKDVLQRCAEAMVRHLGATLTRVWTLAEGEELLELKASAGPCAPGGGPAARAGRAVWGWTDRPGEEAPPEQPSRRGRSV